MAAGNLSKVEEKFEVIWQGAFRGKPCRVIGLDDGMYQASYRTEFDHQVDDDKPPLWKPALGMGEAEQSLLDYIASQLMLAGLVRGHSDALSKARKSLRKKRWHERLFYLFQPTKKLL